MNAESRKLASVDRMERSGIISLTFTEIHLWLAFYDEINGEPLLAAYRELLDDAERAQEPRFYFARDRHRYLVTRALVRTVLAGYLAIQPEECAFSVNPYGRPEIVNKEARNLSLSFNISHTHSLIILGVTRGRAIGVDVENFRQRRAPIEVATHYFAPQEVAALAAVPQELQQYRFFEYWTFKESYIKARGMGLSLPLDKFSFGYPDEQAVEIAIDPELADDPGRWQFWQFRPRPEYLVALCAGQNGLEPPELSIRSAVPMLCERAVPLELLRVSSRQRLHCAQLSP